MLILLLILGVVLLVCGLIGYISTKETLETDATAIMTVSGAAIIPFSLVFLLIFANVLFDTRTIDERLNVYTVENIIIQLEVSRIVENFMQYERDVFESMRNDSPITLLSLFPELRADELVNRRLNTYIENNDRIRALREEQVNASNLRWWLFFGR